MNDNIILMIAEILSKILDDGIMILGIIELFIMLIAWGKLIVLKKDIKELNNPSGKRLKSRSKKGKKVKKEYVQEDELDWTEFDDFCDRYQKEGVWYALFSMIIQLFTLLGILGTVAGLFISLRHMENISQSKELLDGVKFALSSTILGIILAVIYKFFDIIIGSVWVNYIDDGITIFKNNYREDNTSSESGVVS